MWDLRIVPHVLVSVTRRPRLPFYGCAAQMYLAKFIIIITHTYLQPAEYSCLYAYGFRTNYMIWDRHLGSISLEKTESSPLGALINCP